jgi:hypothetical protein
LSIHNPDDKNSPVHQYLKKCAEVSGCILDESLVKVTSYDFKKKALQSDNDLTVIGEKTWGYNVKAIMKYVVLRFKYG